MDGWNWILVDNVDLPYLVARPNEEIMLRALCEDFKNTTNIFIIRLDLGQTRGTLTVYALTVGAYLVSECYALLRKLRNRSIP